MGGVQSPLLPQQGVVVEVGRSHGREFLPAVEAVVSVGPEAEALHFDGGEVDRCGGESGVNRVSLWRGSYVV